MSVTVADGLIRLAGQCSVEDAEPLLVALQQQRAAAIDLADATGLHTAIVQLLLAARRPIAAPPRHAFLRSFVLPLLGVNPDHGAVSR